MKNKPAKFKREFEITNFFTVFKGLGFGAGIASLNKKLTHSRSRKVFSIVFLCFDYTIELSYNYKK